MTTLVLTVVGDDRAGLVSAVADIVAAHGGNWENSQLAELAGAFAGIIEVEVAPAQTAALRSALAGLDGLLTVAVHAGGASIRDAAASPLLEFHVLGNDRAGIVREISSTLSGLGISIERMATQTRDAAMAGGRLFDATVAARVPASVDIDVVITQLERLAAEIQVDVTLAS